MDSQLSVPHGMNK